MRSNQVGVALLLAGFASALSAQTSTSFQEQSKLIKAPNAVTVIGNDLFGDTVNLYNGTLQFSQVDVMLPGNNNLQVRIGRTVAAGQYLFDDRPFGRWNLDIPRMHGMFAKGTTSLVGWKAKDGSNSRCSVFGAPPLADGLNYKSEWAASKFWQGNFMYIPGQGEQQMLSRSAAFTDAPNAFTIDSVQVSSFPVVTSGKWAIGCLPSLASDTTPSKTMGQGFVAVSPDGTKYKFDWMVTYQANSLTKPFEVSEPALSDPPLPESITAAMAVEAPLEPPGTDAVTTPTLPMTEVWILPTKVIDRFGNTVTYTYNPARPANLKSIVSSDGRSITLTYHLDASGAETARIKTVSDGMRTWTYSYQTGVFTDLSQVQLPDGSKWQLAGITPLFAAVQYQQLGDIYCSAKPMPFQTVLTGSMTHPSGATGTFTLVPTEHGRSDVPYYCMNYRYVYPVHYFTQSLTEKSITGPGLGQFKWTYAYGPSNASTAPCNGCVTTKSVVVTNPEGHANRYVYGNQFYVSEGRLEQLDEGWNGSSALRTTLYAYRTREAADAYPVEDGTSDEVLGDGGTNLRNRPEERKTILQQDVAFVRVSENFDKFLRPTKITKTDSNGSLKQDHITFEHNTARWVLGNVQQVISAGVIPVVTTYDQTSLLPKTVTEFGKLKQSFTYHADGNIHTATDGKGQVTTYTNYKRGIPQNVRLNRHDYRRHS